MSRETHHEALRTLLFSMVFLVGGCASGRGSSTSSSSAAPATAPGISYHLPITLFEVQAKKTETAVNVVDGGELKSTEPVEVTGDVTVRTVAEVTRRSLELKSGAFADGSLTVSISPDGYLTGINSSVEGKAGTAISNIFQIAGRVLGAMTLIGARVAGDPPDAIRQPETVQCSASGLPSELAEDAFDNGVPDPTFFAGDTVGHFFVTHSQVGCAAWKDLIKARATVRAQLRTVQLEEAALRGTSTNDQAKRIFERIQLAETALRRFQATETERAATYESDLAEFKKGNGMNSKTTKVVEMRESFTLPELPPLTLLTAFDKTSLATALQPKFKHMSSLLEAGVILALIDPITVDANASCAGSDVLYRDPVVVRIAVFRADKGRDFKKIDERSVTALGGPERCAKIEQSSFANRALVMEFGDFGVPKKLQRTNSSVAAAATGALSSALTSLTNTYAESLEKVIAIQGSRRTIAQSDLADQIARLTKQKELLDARVSFEGAAASEDLVLQQKLAEQQLALLQKEFDLKKFGQGADTQLEIAGLKDRIALLEQQLALLVAQKKLDEASKP